MILIKILEHDLHRTRSNGLMAFMQEIPVLDSSVPAIISSTRGKFLVSERLVNNKIRVGVFEYDSDHIDLIIGDLFKKAYDLSVKMGWNNIFKGPKSAFNYIVNSTGGMIGQPHACLIPISWGVDDILKFFGKTNITLPENDSTINMKYMKYCRIYHSNTEFPVFLSRPDMVGLYTQFMGGHSSILLHNVKFGIAFCQI